MSTNANPSQNPADLGDFTGAMKIILGKFLQSIDDMLPAKVISYDRTTNRATVQPIIARVTTGGERVSRAQVANVPVFQIGAGNFILNFPVKPGDLGYIKACDADVSLFMQSFREEVPNTARQHKFSDAVFFPQIMTGYTIDGADSDNVVLQNLDGTVKISMGADSINMVATDITIVSTTLTHNGKNIGSTHIHTGVDPGGGTSGPPA